MEIDVLVCHPDGTQTLEKKTVPDDYFRTTPEPEPMTTEELIMDKQTELEYRQDLVALGLAEGGIL